MASTILIKRSSTALAVPTTGDLAQGELAVNTADKKLYTNNGGAIIEIGTAPSAVDVSGNADVGGTLDVTGNTTLSTGSTTGNFSVAGQLTLSTEGTLSTHVVTKGYVDAAVSAVLDSAPAALDTLNELAAALNDDANFANTVTNSIATKVSKAGDTMTGDLVMGANSVTTTANPVSDNDLTRKGYVDGILGSATAAATSAAQAVVSDSSASLSASAAANSETNASSSSDSAFTSATAAASSASSASSSASSASASATAAATSAGNAATSATNAENAWDSFDDRYLGVKSSNPTTDNDGQTLLEGALYFNSAVDSMKVWTGSAWQDVVDLSGDVTVNSLTSNGAVIFKDSFTMGNAIDEQVFRVNNNYVAGSPPFPTINSTSIEIGEPLVSSDMDTNVSIYGDVSIRSGLSSSLVLKNKPADSEVHIGSSAHGFLGTDSDVVVVQGGDEKLRATSTGVDVTGTVTADGLVVDGDVDIQDTTLSNTNTLLTLRDNRSTTDEENYVFAITRQNSTTPALYFGNNDLNEAVIAGNNTSVLFGKDVSGTFNQTMKVGGNGDVQFFEDTGTTAKMTWDASAESLGIGTASPSEVLHVYHPTSNINALIESGDANAYLAFKDSATTNASSVFLGASGDNMTFHSGGASERMRIDSSGNVGIGTSSPVGTLTIQGAAGTNGIGQGLGLLYSNGTQFGAFGLNNSSGWPQLMARSNAGITFHTNSDLYTSNERMRIDSSGNVGIGRNPTSHRLEIDGEFKLTNLTDDGIDFYSTNSNRASIVKNDTALSFCNSADSNRVERMRIDSSGNVGIGTTSPDAKFTVNGGTSNTVALFESSDSGSAIAFADNSTSQWYNNRIGGVGDNLTFTTSSTERMRLDSSGNLLVGKTAISTATVGHMQLSSGLTTSTRSDGEVQVLNRLGTEDGDITQFRKDGATVGSIGAFGGDVFIGTGISGVRFNNGGSAITPVNTTSGSIANSNGVVSLGESDKRFKDLYLSGGVHLGGTGAANKLDDYEEGTFAPVVKGNSTAGTTTYSLRYGSYVKVGRAVYFTLQVEWTNITGSSGYLLFDGLPFTVTGDANSRYGSITLGYANNFTWGSGTPSLHTKPSSTAIYIGSSSSGSSWTNTTIDTSGAVIISGTYQTDL